jgi:ComF family protein
LNQGKVYNWLKNIQPSRCLLCLAPGHYGGSLLCGGCHADLPWLHNACPLCAVPMPGPDQLCGQCQTRRPSYAQIVAPLRYAFPLDALIPAFKHHEQLAYGRLIAGLMVSAITFHYQERGQAYPDCLIAMPLHRRRLAERGFNQAQELARPIARQLDLTLRSDLLHRTRATPSQQGLAAKERRHNLVGAFTCPRPEQLGGLHVALIDDVVTTGSTVEEATRTLLDAGAQSVSIWCAARTP